MSHDRGIETLAHRVLERWCLVGDEPMEGGQWDSMCIMAGVDPVKFAQSAQFLLTRMTPTERTARLRQLARERSQDRPEMDRWGTDAA